MADLKKAIDAVEYGIRAAECAGGGERLGRSSIVMMKTVDLDNILELLKEQEPRIITEEDFENSAIASDVGEIPCWEESREFDETFPCIILRVTFAEDHPDKRYWTSRPTNEQRRAKEWK